jgi:hypothetical protein
MAFKAKFSFDGGQSDGYNIISCSYHFYQDTDVTGRPSSVARGGQITVTVESSDDNKLLEWMIDSYKLHGGSLKFFKRDSESAIMKQVDYTDAYLVGYDETFTHESSMPMLLTVTLSAKTIKVGSAEHKNEWIK